MIEPIPIEGEKNKLLKLKINEIIAYLTDKEQKERTQPNPVHTYRMTLQTSTLADEPVEVPDEVPVGTMEEVSDKLVKVKRARGWEYLSHENWLKESEGK